MPGFLVANAELTPTPGKDARGEMASSTIRWLDARKELHVAKVASDVLHETFQANTNWRSGAKYPGRRNFHGSYWFSGTARHIHFESGFEQVALLVLDFDGDVAGIAAQPFQIDFGRKHSPSTHVPDFFYVRRDGTQSVLDVRPANRIDEKAKESFLATRTVCKTIGWTYEVFAWIDPTYLLNIKWLAKYRHPRNAPPAEVERTLLDYFEREKRLRDVVIDLPQYNAARLLAWSYYLLWKRALRVNMRVSLSPQHLVQTVERA